MHASLDKSELATEIRLVSLNVGLPAYLGRDRGKPVTSGFKKRPVDQEFVEIGLTNISGDGQADLSVHGGPEKAVYAYAVDRHAEWLAAVPDLAGIGPAYFGENLSVAGWTESNVRIGDVWEWGSTRLQVCQPRWPCYKFSMATGHPEFGKIMLRHGWTGWYLRVLTPGEAPVRGPIRLAERGPENVTVYDAHAANLPHAGRDLIERVVAAPGLAVNWRQALEHGLANR